MLAGIFVPAANFVLLANFVLAEFFVPAVNFVLAAIFVLASQQLWPRRDGQLT